MHKLIVISAPSGCGKTTIAHAIMNRHPEIEFSVSATTRPRRGNEEHGKDYFFLTRDEFVQGIDAGRFVEWEEIYQNFYGTLKDEVERLLRAGKSVMFDIDVKGALSIKKQYPEAVLIFIKPPSEQELLSRLENRKTDDPDSIRKRIERMPMELGMEKEFDHAVVNDDLDRAVEEVDRIVMQNGTAAPPGRV